MKVLLVNLYCYFVALDFFDEQNFNKQLDFIMVVNVRRSLFVTDDFNIGGIH